MHRDGKQTMNGWALAISIVLFLAVGCSLAISDFNPELVSQISAIWNNISQPKPPNQLRIGAETSQNAQYCSEHYIPEHNASDCSAYLSSSPDYMTSAQTISYAFNQSSLNSSAQLRAIDVQFLPVQVPVYFPFSYSQSIIVQLYNFQVDLVISDGNWINSVIAEALQVPVILLYSSFPNTTSFTSLIANFIVGFFTPNYPSPPQNQFSMLYSILSGPQYSNGYNQYYQPSYAYYQTQYYYYYPLPTNTLSFKKPLISYNPLIEQLSIINNNISIILDSNLPYQFDMQFFQTITASVITKTPTNAVYIVTIPRNPTQLELNNIVQNLQAYTGPRFVYATHQVAVNLINSIDQLGAFSTSFVAPVYQWHFLNLTGGLAYDQELQDEICSPYIYHWEIYNLTAYQSNCPLIAEASNTSFNRILECDFGYFLNNVLYSYLQQMNSSCQFQGGFCTNKASILQNIINNPSVAPNSPPLATGPMAYSVTGNRQGMMSNLYLGADSGNAKLRSTCTVNITTGNWTCSTLNYTQTTTQQVNKNVQMVAFFSPPFFYVNTTTGQFDGFYASLAQLLVQQLGIKSYNIYGVSEIGVYNATTASWSGCLGEVLKSADVAMAPMETIPNLTNTLAFSTPYAQVTFSVVQQVPDPTVTFGTLFSQIFRPWTFVNWLLQLASIVMVSLLLTFLDYFSPNLVTFNLRRSWFYVFARSVMGAGGQNPDVFSSQILMLFWSFVTMISISTYTANLAALSIDQQLNSPYISKFSDLASGHWQPCCVSKSYTSFYFMQSKVPLEVAVWQSMRFCQFSDYDEAFSVLTNWSNPNASSMALVTLQPSASYGANLYSNLIIVANYTLVNLVMITPNGLQASLPIASLNGAIQALSTSGALSKIINTYFKMPYTSFPPNGWTQLSDFFDESAYSTQFTIKTQSGDYLIVGFGIIVAFTCAGIELAFSWLWKAYSSYKRQETRRLLKDLLQSLHSIKVRELSHYNDNLEAGNSRSQTDTIEEKQTPTDIDSPRSEGNDSDSVIDDKKQ